MKTKQPKRNWKGPLTAEEETELQALQAKRWWATNADKNRFRKLCARRSAAIEATEEAQAARDRKDAHKWRLHQAQQLIDEPAELPSPTDPRMPRGGAQ
jgi:hypothetical protein